MFIDVPHPIHFACQYTVIVHYLLDLLPTTSKSAEFRTYIYIHNHNIKYLPQRKLPFSMINCTLRSKLSKLYLVRWFSHTCSCVHIYRLLFDIFYHKTQAILVDFPASHRRVWRFPGPTRARFLLHELGDEACCDLNSWGLVEQDMRIQGGICTNHKTRWYKINDV
jgi:hypothetical protein